MSDDFEKFKACAVEILAVSPDQVTMEAKFSEDLDADSLDLVELDHRRGNRLQVRDAALLGVLLSQGL